MGHMKYVELYDAYWILLEILQLVCLVHEHLIELLDLIPKHKSSSTKVRYFRVILNMIMSLEIAIGTLHVHFHFNICCINMIEAPHELIVSLYLPMKFPLQRTPFGAYMTFCLITPQNLLLAYF